MFAGLARDEFEAVSAQREDRVGGIAGRIFQRRSEHVGLVGLDACELLVGRGMRDDPHGRRLRLPCAQVLCRVDQGDRGAFDGIGTLVSQRGAHPEVFLGVAGIGAADRRVAFDGQIDRQHRAGIRNRDAAGLLRGSGRSDIGILREARRSQAERENERCCVFHGL